MPRQFSKPPRLPVVIQSQPLYFVTFCTMYRRRLLANETVHEAFRQYARAGLEHGVGVGQYILMPEHAHLFVRMSGTTTLGRWIGGLKRAMSPVGPSVVGCQVATLLSEDPKVSPSATTHQLDNSTTKTWQPGFFDHLLRHDESYAQKWLYVRDNPVRKRLVATWDAWPYRGEIVVIDRA